MSQPRYDKHGCFARAEALLAKGDDESLRYVCLELRFCLEAISYEKLRLYAPRLPRGTFEKLWQPPQVVRALLEFEPHADQDFELRVGRETTLGVPASELHIVGVHRTFRLAWLRKTYNKLGNFLHIPTPPSGAVSQQPEPRRSDLEAILGDVRAVLTSAVDSSLAKVVEFECAACRATVIVNEDRLRKNPHVRCLNSACNSEHVAVFSTQDADSPIHFERYAKSFECLDCGKAISISISDLIHGYAFECSACHARHQILETEWGYARLPD
jgi:hypothetical protein